jgi:hypothetical protein
LIAFTSNLQYCTCLRLQKTSHKSHGHQTFVECFTCRWCCSTSGPCFTIDVDLQAMTFSIDMNEYCPHQPWQCYTEETRQDLMKFPTSGTSISCHGKGSHEISDVSSRPILV